MPVSVARLNRELADRFGRNPYGEPHFRFVHAATRTTTLDGRQVMAYPHPTEYVEPVVTYYAVEADGSRRALDAPDEAPGALVGVETVYRQRGAPFWVLEGWRPGAVVAANWDASDGEAPSRGDYLPLWFCKGERGEPREPSDRDLEELARRVALQAESETLRHQRWEQGFDATRYNDRVAASKREREQRVAEDGERFEEECREWFRDYFATTARVTTS